MTNYLNDNTEVLVSVKKNQILLLTIRSALISLFFVPALAMAQLDSVKTLNAILSILNYDSDNLPQPEPAQFMWPPEHTTEGHGQCQLTNPQAANCTFLITPDSFSGRVLVKSDRALSPLDGSPNRTVGPGDKVCVAPGYYKSTIIHRIAGTEAEPITITNCGGQAVFRDEVPVSESRHIKLLGNGHDGTLYGFKIMGTLEEEAQFIAKYGAGFQTNSQPALDIGELSRNIEIAWMEISNPRGPRAPGIHFVTKTLTDTEGNLIVQYDLEHPDRVFVQTGTHIHHNYIHNSLEAEGMYVGRFGCDQEAFDAGFALEDTQIHDNIVTHIGGDGIQVGCARANTNIYNNYVHNVGYNPFNNRGHTKGVQLGQGTSGHLYNNYIDRGASDCVWAAGGPSDDDSSVSLWIYNNVFRNCEQAIGITRDARDTVDADQTIEVYNNTVVSMRSAHYFVSYALYNDIKINTINNLYVDQQADFQRFVQGPTPNNFSESHQFISVGSVSLHFVDANAGNYGLTKASPVIDIGTPLPLLPISDLTGKARDSLYDVGAFEYRD